MIEIQLTRGQVTYVDDIDADLAQFKWHAAFDSEYANGGAYIARRSLKIGVNQWRFQTLHTVILSRMLERGLEPGELVDHRDLNPLNNQRENLRLATYSDNMHNRSKMKNNTSGYIGVTWHKTNKKWRASIECNKVCEYLGSYDDPIEAAKARDKAAKRLHGEFAVLNFPNE